MYLLLLNLILFSFYSDTNGYLLYAPIDSGGIRGNITFIKHQQQIDEIEINVYLYTSSNINNNNNNNNNNNVEQTFDWAIHEFPVFFDRKNPCQSQELGKTIYDLTNKHGHLKISSSSSTMVKQQKFIDKNLRLMGKKTIWMRSIYLKSTNNQQHQRSCTNIMTISNNQIQSAIIRFNQIISGDIFIRQNEFFETIIYTNLYYNLQNDKNTMITKNDWKIMVTDILDKNSDENIKCNQLQILFDPNNLNDTNCNLNNNDNNFDNNNDNNCKIGDLTSKHGQLIIGNNNNRYSKKFFVDLNLSIFDYLSDDDDNSRTLFIVIYNKNNNNKIMTCAPIRKLLSKEVHAHFDSDGVKGDILFKQNYKIDPTIITIKLNNLRGRGRQYSIHSNPIKQQQQKFDINEQCQRQTGERFNPFNVDNNQDTTKIDNNKFTNDQFDVGDLSGKHGELNDIQDIQIYFNSHIDFNLPLFGIHSIIGRSIVIYNNNGQRWICTNIGYPNNQPTIIARAIFYYPIIGEIIFRQSLNDPFGDTTVYGELFYSTYYNFNNNQNFNNQNNAIKNITHNHQWRIHQSFVGQDFFNWTKRCHSTGDIYNPFNIITTTNNNQRQYQQQCSIDNQLRCQIGDLYMKYKKISINYLFSNQSTTFLYTDTLLPLSGKYSIISRSIVIDDDMAPTIRGKRMACATIKRLHPITAVVNEWHTSAGIQSNISGTIEFYQESLFDETRIKVNLRGLNKLASGYHIHKAPVPMDKEFPCSGDILYGHYNPFEIDSSIGPLPSIGSVDEYETGDLSGKFGLLNNLDKLNNEYNDFTISLLGVNSVIGRSIVIHREENNFRWSCSTIRTKIDKNKQREIIAIASFDDSRNLIQGYIRFKQIEYWDGSLSDTWIETYLYYRNNNKKVTYGHKWSIYVNQVGSDAYNQIDSVRCLAAGYLWNPYLANIDNDKLSYRYECSPKYPLRCALGDLNGRHSPLIIGGDRQFYSDINLPLVGNNSIINRAIIITKQNQSDTSLACTNIKLDKHLLSTIVVQKVPSFTVQKFMYHMRLKLNTTEWLIVPDIQNVKHINNDECVQIMVHFYGDEAWKLQSEFNNLIEYGSIKRMTANGELIKTYYKSCKTALLTSILSSSSLPTTKLINHSLLLFIIITWFLNH